MKMNIYLALMIWGFLYSIPTSLSAQEIPENAFSQGSQWYCNTGYKKEGNQCIKFKVPANAFAQGAQWYCNTGYKKKNEKCYKINVPANAFAQGSQWYCNTGYKKQGNQCIKFKVPANAFAQGAQWYCNTGYKKKNEKCYKINVPANAFAQGSQWYCNTGYKKQGNQCIKFSIPANAFTQGSQWYCNIGFKKSGVECIEMSEKEKKQQERYLAEARSIKNSCRNSEDAGIVVKEDVCGSGNSIIETTDGWYIAAEHYSGIYLYEDDIVCIKMKTYGFQELYRPDGSKGRFYIEDWENSIVSAYEELCD